MVEIKIGGKYKWQKNPFLTKGNMITVIDIKSGWCKYVYGCVWFNKLIGCTFTHELDKAERWWYYWED